MRLNAKLKVVNTAVALLKGRFKGEQLFDETEKIYKQHGYHPIQNILQGASFFVVLPVLISALFLFSKEGILDGKSFLFISNLSQPDRLLGPVNILPIVMSVITLIDAAMRFKNDKSAQIRFFVVALVLLALVYFLPSGLVLYWIGSNVFSMATWHLVRHPNLHEI